jgi:hypothetical protein
MVGLLNDTELRKKLVGTGLERAGCFSWERTARETIGIYQQIAGAG